MIRLRSLALSLLLPLAALTGCADGGPVGTGVSGLSTISGNVVAVEDTGGEGTVGVAEVRVSIDDVPGTDAVTDAEGNFQLSGDFAGELTLRFRSARVVATARVEVPERAELVLQDIVVATSGVRFEAVRVIGFLGHAAMVDCDEGVLLLNDSRPVPNQFLVRITEDTILLRGNGMPLACDELAPGDAVAVEGAVRIADRTIVAFTLTLEPPPPGSRPLIREVRFRGTLAVANCPGGMVLLDDAAIGRTRLRLSRDTVIVDPDGRPIACSDLGVGDRAEGRGTINVRRPEVVEALLLIVHPPR